MGYTVPSFPYSPRVRGFCPFLLLYDHFWVGAGVQESFEFSLILYIFLSGAIFIRRILRIRSFSLAKECDVSFPAHGICDIPNAVYSAQSARESFTIFFAHFCSMPRICARVATL